MFESVHILWYQTDFCYLRQLTHSDVPPHVSNWHTRSMKHISNTLTYKNRNFYPKMNGGINFHFRFGGLKACVLSDCEVYSNVYVLDRAWYQLPINYTWDSLGVHKELHIVQGHTMLRDENCTFLGYYAGSSGNSLRTFRDNISVPSSRVKNPKREWILHSWRWER